MTTAVTSVCLNAYAPVAELLRNRPSSRAFASERANWLWKMAAALNDVGHPEEANAARESALHVVRAAIEVVAGTADTRSKGEDK